MEDLLMQAGPAGIVAVLIVREFLGILKDKKDSNDKKDDHQISLEMWNEVENKINALHDQHNKFDEDGVPNWYVKKSLYESQKEVIGHLNVQSQLINGMIDKMRTIENTLNHIEKKVRKD